MSTILLIDNQVIAAETKVPFLLSLAMVPATLWCMGVAESGEDIEIQKLMSAARINDALESHWTTIKRDNAAEVLSGQTNVRTIDGPGAYRIKTPTATAAAITVGLDR